MDCNEYINSYLSAHADGELRGTQLRDAEEHVASGGPCARRLAEERALKALVRGHAAKVATPAAIRERLLTLLAEEAARGEGPDAGAATSSSRSTSRARGINSLRRPAIWIPLSIAAGLALTIVTVRGFGLFPNNPVKIAHPAGGISEFDTAIASFEKFNQHFEPNVPSETYGDVASAYMDAHMPGYIWNFNGSGLRLVGGRIEKLPDGRAATYTLYRGGHSAILCVRFKLASGPNPPPGALLQIGSQEFYSYHGYTICYSYSPERDFVCLLVTRQPVNQLIESIEYASE